MKKMGLLLLLAVAAVAVVGLSTDRASAVPAFNKQWLATYEKSPAIEAAKEAKCNLCHVPDEKKTVRNAYGATLTKFVTKDDYNNLKGDADALKAKLEDAFKKAAAEKAPSGETWGKLFEGGKVPEPVKAP